MMRLLDLFCGAGGAGMGYHQAGFEVVGVDIAPQPRYPFEFHQADALEYLAEHGREFDVIHASPECQMYSITASLRSKDYSMLIPDVRNLLLQVGKPYIIENVPRAPLIDPLILCGTMFDLQVLRHRLFETSPRLVFPPFTCNHKGLATSGNLRRRGITRTPSLSDGFEYVTVVGNNYLKAEGAAAMGIDWMSKAELSQAIPPVYTEYVGKQLLQLLK